jgi:hypothetical protein
MTSFLLYKFTQIELSIFFNTNFMVLKFFLRLGIIGTPTLSYLISPDLDQQPLIFLSHLLLTFFFEVGTTILYKYGADARFHWGPFIHIRLGFRAKMLEYKHVKCIPTVLSM